MTNQEAYEISNSLIYLEFPLFYDLAVRLALFETYAMENIAKLLVAVSDLNKPDQAPKRYEDTEIVYSCFAMFPPTSTQLHKAVARMNYLHSPYIKNGKILQKDLLYTLYISFAEPVRFLNQYEWRSLTDMEVAALATLWKYIGDMMEIDYKTILQKDEWTDGIEFFEHLTAWAEKYEDDFLKPIPEVKALGEVLMKMLLQSHSPILRPLGYKVALVLMGNRLRDAFGFPEQSIAITTLTYSLLRMRQFVVRYLCLPRIFPAHYISEPDEATGRIKHYHYLKEPWYCAPTFWARWNPEALFTWISGGMIPGDGGEGLKPEGLLFEDLGPSNTVGKGVEEMEILTDRARMRGVGGCPFATVTKA
ncbi:hypothetical protein G7046_g2117 [Stylonectria norvegica]|nr:hypothetical protein G7046_g2117 [Stylonectria norvegica]